MIQDTKLKIRSNMVMLYAFALTSHCIMLTVFILYQINIMVCFNIGSIILYIALIIMTKKYLNHRTKVFNILSSTIEVITHQILAVICVGDNIGFQYFLIMIGVVFILQPNDVVRKKYKIPSCVFIILVMISIELYMSSRTPLYAIPPNVRIILLTVITLSSVIGIFTFTISQWNLGEHYRRQIEMLLSDRNVQIQDMQEKIIRNFADIVEKRDGSTGGHIKRTSAYVEAITESLVDSGKFSDILTPEYSKMIISAAPLHDIGKISISDSILCKRGKLTEEEYEIMKTHSMVGGSMLKDLLGDLESDEYVNLATDISKYHHEKWNGKGYSEGISGFNIPLSARIMAVADVFDALTSVRVYKDKYSLDKAYSIMESEAGQQFDPDIITEFIRIKPRISEICNSLNEA